MVVITKTVTYADSTKMVNPTDIAADVEEDKKEFVI